MILTYNVLCRLSGVGVIRVHAILAAASHLWFTCIREVFKKNFTPVLYFVHPPPRLLLVIDHPTGISETCPKQYESTRLCLKTVAPSNTDRNESYR